ncbi:MAG: hypothetical protein WC761_00380 [Candidatus Paceibacterota bacterium]|jgi:hypothetical protein
MTNKDTSVVSLIEDGPSSEGAPLKKEGEGGGAWDSLLTTEAKEGEEYIKPNIEHKLSSAKRQECRDILREIKTFGVSQRQMLYLIYLMSLELEDTVTTKALVKAVGENRDKIPVSVLETGPRKVNAPSKIILE